MNVTSTYMWTTRQSQRTETMKCVIRVMWTVKKRRKIMTDPSEVRHQGDVASEEEDEDHARPQPWLPKW